MPFKTVYFIKPVGFDGPIKIGYSEVPEDRLYTLAGWSPFPLELIGSVPGNRSDEKFLHECFATSYSHREWFHPSPLLLTTISKILEAQTIDVVRDCFLTRRSLPKKMRAPRTIVRERAL